MQCWESTELQDQVNTSSFTVLDPIPSADPQSPCRRIILPLHWWALWDDWSRLLICLWGSWGSYPLLVPGQRGAPLPAVPWHGVPGNIPLNRTPRAGKVTVFSLTGCRWWQLRYCMMEWDPPRWPPCSENTWSKGQQEENSYSNRHDCVHKTEPVYYNGLSVRFTPIKWYRRTAAVSFTFIQALTFIREAIT